MLKPPNEPEHGPDDSDRPVGDLVHELIEDGKVYARAEFAVAKAMVAAKVRAFRVPAILFGVAFVLLLASISALAFGVAAALSTLIGPLAGGVVAFLLFAGIAGGLAWFGAKKLREDL